MRSDLFNSNSLDLEVKPSSHVNGMKAEQRDKQTEASELKTIDPT